MKELRGRVAVVTGAGSGIGRGIARALARAGMRVAVADIERETAEAVAAELAASGADALAVRTDVSSRADWLWLRDAVLREFGAVHVVCNNAGIYVGGPVLDIAESDWEWTLGVNVMGVVHGSQVFAPLLAQQGAGHIVNTASIGGWIAGPDMSAYCSSKFAVVGFSEALRAELAETGVAVSTLCPGPIDTNLDRSDRLRPEDLDPGKARSGGLRAMIDGGMEPDEVGELVRLGIEEDREYIFTHAAFRDLLSAKFERALAAFEGL
jgi:NAD(P)-dependent dehydrogenase (short-subunit alcohol dehydrogenase family)